MITLASELEETRSDDRSRNYNIHPVKERREARSDTIKSGSCNSIFSWSCSLLSGFCCCHVKKYCTMSMVLSFFFKTALRELGLALFCGMARGMAMLVGYICPDWNISTFAWIAMTLTIPSGWTHLTLVICWPFFSHKHVNIFFSSLLWNISTFYKQDQRNIWLCAKIMNCKDLLYWLFSCSAWGCMRLMLLVQSSSSQLFNGLR